MFGVALVLIAHTFSSLDSLVGGFDFDKFFRVISILGSALTAFKLYQTGLHSRYRFFFAYMVFRVPCMSWGLFLKTSDDNYYWLFTRSEPVIMLFYVLIVLELYRLVLERYKGLYTLGRWAMGAAMAIALFVSMWGLRGSTTHEVQKFSYWVVFELRAEARLDLALVQRPPNKRISE